MDTSQIIDKSRSLVADHYLFPEVAASVAALLAANLDAGRYRAAAGPQDLAKLVTEDLQSFNRDGHLRLIHHAEEIPDLPSGEMTDATDRRRASRDLNGLRRVERVHDNIALIEVEEFYSPHISGDAFAAAMNLVATADALIVDVRRCRGGAPATVALMCGYLFGDQPVHLNDMYEREGDRISQSWTPGFVPGRKFGPDKPICVLTGSATFSGGEEFAYDLQQLGRATIVGETTGGGANPRIGFRLHPHLELAVPTGRAINPVTGTNWEGVGVVPDVAVPAAEALDTALGILKGLFAGR